MNSDVTCGGSARPRQVVPENLSGWNQMTGCRSYDIYRTRVADYRKGTEPADHRIQGPPGIETLLGNFDGIIFIDHTCAFRA
jgi:hypothetical protein